MAMKIGLMFNHWSYRKDLRLVIDEMVKGGDSFVLFSNQKLPLTSNGVILRGYQRSESYLLRCLRKIYFYFRQIPKTRMNFHLMELFRHKLLDGSSNISFTIAYIIRTCRVNVIKYDWYLKLLGELNPIQAEISDLDCFILVSDIPSDDFAAIAYKTNKPVFVLVYSWDHIYKFTRFTKFFKYIVWSQGLKDDLEMMWGIKKSDIFVLGPLPFHNLATAQRLADRSTQIPQDYILYCFSTGLKELIEEEINLVLRIRDFLMSTGSKQKIVCRLYPVINNWNVYDRLYNEKGLDVVSKDDVLNGVKVPKNDQIRNARFVIHSGSTIGIEAILLGVNSVMIDLSSEFNRIKKSQNKVCLKNHIYQYQNVRFFPKEIFLTDVTEICQFNRVTDLRDFNSCIVNEFKPITFKKFSIDLANLIREVVSA